MLKLAPNLFLAAAPFLGAVALFTSQGAFAAETLAELKQRANEQMKAVEVSPTHLSDVKLGQGLNTFSGQVLPSCLEQPEVERFANGSADVRAGDGQGMKSVMQDYYSQVPIYGVGAIFEGKQAAARYAQAAASAYGSFASEVSKNVVVVKEQLRGAAGLTANAAAIQSSEKWMEQCGNKVVQVRSLGVRSRLQLRLDGPRALTTEAKRLESSEQVAAFLATHPEGKDVFVTLAYLSQGFSDAALSKEVGVEIKNGYLEVRGTVQDIPNMRLLQQELIAAESKLLQALPGGTQPTADVPFAVVGIGIDNYDILHSEKANVLGEQLDKVALIPLSSLAHGYRAADSFFAVKRFVDQSNPFYFTPYQLSRGREQLVSALGDIQLEIAGLLAAPYFLRSSDPQNGWVELTPKQLEREERLIQDDIKKLEDLLENSLRDPS